MLYVAPDNAVGSNKKHFFLPVIGQFQLLTSLCHLSPATYCTHKVNNQVLLWAQSPQLALRDCATTGFNLRRNLVTVRPSKNRGEFRQFQRGPSHQAKSNKKFILVDLFTRQGKIRQSRSIKWDAEENLTSVLQELLFCYFHWLERWGCSKDRCNSSWLHPSSQCSVSSHSYDLQFEWLYSNLAYCVGRDWEKR